MGTPESSGGGAPERRALIGPPSAGFGVPDGGGGGVPDGGGGLVPDGGGGGGMLPLGRGINVPSGVKWGCDFGSGEEPGAVFSALFGSLLSTWRNCQRCRAKNDQSTHWSACNKCSGGDGEKDGETHIDVVS